MNRTNLVTGGAGFIGTALVLHLLWGTPHRVDNRLERPRPPEAATA